MKALHGLVAVTLAIASQAAPGAQTEPGGIVLAPIVRTERPGAGVIRVVYDLRGTTGMVFTVSLEASNDGGQTFAIRPRATTGGVGPGIPLTMVDNQCTNTSTWRFDLTLRLDLASDGNVTASVVGATTSTLTATGCTSGTAGTTVQENGILLTPVSGTTSRIVFSGRATRRLPDGRDRTDEWSFTGSLASDVISARLNSLSTFPPRPDWEAPDST